MISLAHIAFAITSLILGAFVLLNAKGTQQHRWVGLLYCASMLGLNFTALDIYHLTGHFNFFHLSAFISLAMVSMGWLQIRLRRRLSNWLYRHYIYMCWSYAALVAAAFNEGFVRLAPLQALVRHSGNGVIILTQVALLSGTAFFINRSKARMLRRYGNTKFAD